MVVTTILLNKMVRESTPGSILRQTAQVSLTRSRVEPNSGGSSGNPLSTSTKKAAQATIGQRGWAEVARDYPIRIIRIVE